MILQNMWWFGVFLLLEFPVGLVSQTGGAPRPKSEQKSECYFLGKAQRCQPVFENAAFGRRVEATSTCGEHRTIRYCQSGSCQFCVMGDSNQQYPAIYLTDFNNAKNDTWWQSETMLEDIQYPNHVNLTLNLGKAFDITYIRLKFKSPRPESFVIYKRTTSESSWEPYHYYSSSCRDTYGLPNLFYLQEGSEDKAVCTSEFTDLVPLTGGSVAFATLEGRPGGLQFDYSASLQKWVTATAIRITLQRLNTFGDEVFRDPSVLQSYFYAITDLAVGATCKCNGHASQCVERSGSRSDNDHLTSGSLMCQCQHNTDGVDCERCLPFYNDLPWKRATPRDAHECRACNCNGFSDVCYFDKELYELTGHGGHCTNCSSNRDGANCEHCLVNHFEQDTGQCAPCLCHPEGSRSLQCNSNGVCTCKPGVGGDKCDYCLPNFYNFHEQGCSPCNCLKKGSIDNEPYCDPQSGMCRCKVNIEGQMCDRCKPGFFAISADNKFGCSPCFCYGHSSVCSTADGYTEVMVNTEFLRGDEDWKAENFHGDSASLKYLPLYRSIATSSEDTEQLTYFSAPDRYLGDQRASYNQELTFTLRIGEEGPEASAQDVMLQGAGMVIYQPIFGQGNPLPEKKSQQYSFTLHEDTGYGWIPRMHTIDFMAILSNLTAIKIRATFSPQGVGFLESFGLVSARRGQLGRPADWIENCRCPSGYVGQFCESCEPGFYHEHRAEGAFSRCVVCNCNGHADICDSNTGKCICEHNTTGDNCELCARGYYGNALLGTDSDCAPCPCPGQGACMELEDGQVTCLECPSGYTGHRCELCIDGWFGEPPAIPCERCDCNENVDENSVENCNRTTGECLKCIYNTAGFYCDQCKAGYFGDALALPKGSCRSCDCNPVATQRTEEVSDEGVAPLLCDQLTGQCMCKPFVSGVKCERCTNGYWNINSGEGCEECGCDSVGSYNASCDVETGRCFCREGVVGDKCNQCDVNMFGFSLEGCRPCDCDPVGSLQLQCSSSGLCTCRENVEGVKCERCKENKYDRQAGCKDCPVCYSLVQKEIDYHRYNLTQLTDLLHEISSGVNVPDGEEFEQRLALLTDEVGKLHDLVALSSASTQTTPQQLMAQMKSRIQEIHRESANIRQLVDQVGRLSKTAGSSLVGAEQTGAKLNEAVNGALLYLSTEGADALSRAVERSQQFGFHSRQMTRMARDARQLASEHRLSADSLLYDADSSVANATAAYNRAYQIIEQQRSFSEVERHLEEKMEDMEAKLITVSNEADQANREASLAYERSLGVYSEAKSGGSLPAVRPLQKRSQALQAAAEKLKTDVQLLSGDLDSLIEQLSSDSANVNQLLNRADVKQRIVDEKMADVASAHEQAKSAVQAGDNTLEEAQRTLTTLMQFDSQVQESRDSASSAMQEVPDISQKLQEAENRTALASRSLSGANSSAVNSQTVAEEAQLLASQVNTSSYDVSQQSVVAKQRSADLLEANNVLSTALSQTEDNISQLNRTVQEERVTDDQLLSDASMARNEVAAVREQLELALADVRNITASLEAAGDIDSAALERLEKRLAEAEEQRNKHRLASRLKQLKDFHMKQQKIAFDQKEDLTKLQDEVYNIEEIVDALPEGCYSRLQLEP